MTSCGIVTENISTEATRNIEVEADEDACLFSGTTCIPLELLILDDEGVLC